MNEVESFITNLMTYLNSDEITRKQILESKPPEDFIKNIFRKILKNIKQFKRPENTICFNFNENWFVNLKYDYYHPRNAVGNEKYFKDIGFRKFYSYMENLAQILDHHKVLSINFEKCFETRSDPETLYFYRGKDLREIFPNEDERQFFIEDHHRSSNKISFGDLTKKNKVIYEANPLRRTNLFELHYNINLGSK